MNPKNGKRLMPQNFDLMRMQEVAKDLAQGYRVTIQASGWSMLPLLWNQRDKLILAPLTEESLQVGRIVLVHTGADKYIIHRIVHIEGDWLTLRGDGNPAQEERCTRAEVLAELVGAVRAGVEIDRSHALWQRIERYWPSSVLMRRVLLALYKRVFITRSLKMTPEIKRKYRF